MSATIFALATPPGKSGVAVIRVSGVHALDSLAAFTDKKITPRFATLANLKHPKTQEIIDRALVVSFVAPASFTGEDSVEYHVHGGRAVVEAMLQALASQPDHRMAEAGEFTRRAFDNGKIDLTEAEGLADLIHAETALQKRQALLQMDGSLGRIYQSWTDRLKKALAHIEADIEFPDEDMPEGILPEMRPVIEALVQEIASHLNDNRRGERLRDGVQIAVIGAPNAGKSSLVNALAQRDVAIVSDFAGTTRDVIEAHLDIGGYPVIIADTAGLRPENLSGSAQEHIENEGMRRALRRAQNADIKILLFDGTQGVDATTLALQDEKSILVFNKTDAGKSKETGVHISAKTGLNIDHLLHEILQKIELLMGGVEAPSITRQRYREQLQECLQALHRGLQAELPELMAEDMRLGIRALGRITGRVDVEDLLDVIFRDFCIGK